MPLTLVVDRLWESPYVFNAFVALQEKGIAYDVQELDLEQGAQHEPAYATPSLTARVPALIHDGFWLTESSAILEYLEEAFPGTPLLYPLDLRERARARQILGWIRSDLLALREERPTTTMFFGRAKDPLGAQAQRAADKLVRVAELLVPKGGATTLFGRWCIADADLSFMLHRLILNGDPVPERLRSYAAESWARPSVRAFVERQRPPLGKPQ